MAEMTIDMGPMMRDAMTASIAELVDTCPQFRFAVIVRLLKTDAFTRMQIAEAMGEAAVREHKADEEAEAVLVSSDFNVDDDRRDLSWDEIMLECLNDLEQTPAGKGELL